MADVTFHDADGVIEDVVHGQGHGTVDGLDALGRRRGFFRHEQFEGVEGRRHVAGEDFEELHVGA